MGVALKLPFQLPDPLAQLAGGCRLWFQGLHFLLKGPEVRRSRRGVIGNSYKLVLQVLDLPGKPEVLGIQL